MSRIRAAHSPNNQATGGNKAGQTEEAVNSINSQSLSCSQPSQSDCGRFTACAMWLCKRHKTEVRKVKRKNGTLGKTVIWMSKLK